MGLDIRLPIGLLFSVIGLLLVGFGAFGDKGIYQRSLGLNVNLAWGAVLLVFGAIMLILGRRLSAIRPDAGSSAGSDVLTARFREVFGASSCIFRAPGRVNVVGEHTDYNDGFVMPAAIQFYTWVAGEKRGDRVLEVYSEHFDEKISLPLDALAGPHRGHWSDFIRGVAAVLQGQPCRSRGSPTRRRAQFLGLSGGRDRACPDLAFRV